LPSPWKQKKFVLLLLALLAHKKEVKAAEDLENGHFPD
jgi:hypothetical protein